MKTFFSELYNKILELFQIEKSENTGDCASSRLQVILMHDRTKLDPLIMNSLREELITVFSKYVVIDKEKLEIDLTNEGAAAALMLNIPIIRAKTEEELEALRNKIKQEEEKNSDCDDSDYVIVEEISGEEQTEESAEISEKAGGADEAVKSEEQPHSEAFCTAPAAEKSEIKKETEAVLKIE